MLIKRRFHSFQLSGPVNLTMFSVEVIVAVAVVVKRFN
jgi:hypothetical protein